MASQPGAAPTAAAAPEPAPETGIERTHDLPAADAAASTSVVPDAGLPAAPVARATTPLSMRRLLVLRSSQLDAELLDNELRTLLAEHVSGMLSVLQPSFKSRFEPEINAALDWLSSEAMLYATGTTYGLALQNLKYRDELQHRGKHELASYIAPVPTERRLAHAILRIGGSWAFARINRFMTRHGWGDGSEGPTRYSIWRWVQRLELGYKIASVANFLVFLLNGRYEIHHTTSERRCESAGADASLPQPTLDRYRSLLDRVLGMRVVYAQQTMSRMISFEFMNRQLVWHAFTEFLLFIIPYVNLNAVRRMIKRQFRQRQEVDLPAHLCAVCFSKNRTSTVLHVPYETQCGHTYCYYCIKTEMLADPAFACPRCGETVKDIRRSAVSLE
ncbi:peroxisome assembly protein (Peroxin-2) [Polyrhizophydium stewartii]|uniref:RING-type E3 ubiquitin transferase (cysteine targeting) n=1 Tax=Polyrhizophydium stewartii TaxID=2732419 RepID=A0ABR4NHU0_9FUNG